MNSKNHNYPSRWPEIYVHDHNALHLPDLNDAENGGIIMAFNNRFDPISAHVLVDNRNSKRLLFASLFLCTCRRSVMAIGAAADLLGCLTLHWKRTTIALIRSILLLAYCSIMGVCVDIKQNEWWGLISSCSPRMQKGTLYCSSLKSSAMLL